ncbi:hypothetical protein Hanom_Chr06g00540601 [Helianthus anomalus]
MIEDRLDINVHAAFNDIEIRIAEARWMEKEQKDAEEATEALKDKEKGVVQQQPDANVNAADVEVNVAENVRRIEIERRRLEAKEAKKAQVDEKVDKEKDDENEEDDGMKDINDFHKSDDDKGDDNDQGGNGGALL